MKTKSKLSKEEKSEIGASKKKPGRPRKIIKKEAVPEKPQALPPTFAGEPPAPEELGSPLEKPRPALRGGPPAEAKRPKKGRYWQGIGRRKSAVALVRMYTSGSEILINSKPYTEYFRLLELQKIVDAPLRKMKLAGKFLVEARVSGGGLRGQAEAVRLGLSRALVAFNAEFRKRLRRVGYLTRDARVKERKKYGLKKARRAPQWQKR